MLCKTFFAVTLTALRYAAIASAIPQPYEGKELLPNRLYARCKPSSKPLTSDTSTSTSTATSSPTSSTTSTTTGITTSTTTSSSALSVCTNYIADPSFEQVSPSDDNEVYFDSGSWAFGGESATMQSNSDYENQDVAYSGEQFGSLVTYDDDPITISQSLSGLTVGSPYLLSYFYEVWAYSGYTGFYCTLTVTYDDVQIDSFIIDAASPYGAGTWTNRNAPLVPTTDSASLVFTNTCTVPGGGPATDVYTIFVDEVTLELNDGSCKIDMTPDGVNPGQ